MEIKPVEDPDQEPEKSLIKKPKAVKKELTSEQLQAKWVEKHEKNLANGMIWRTYAIDDDFDAGDKTGQKRDVYFKDHSAKQYDEVAVEEQEDDDSIYEEIMVSVKLTI